MQNIKEIIRIKDDGTRENVWHGILMEAKDGKSRIDFLHVNKMELVEFTCLLLLTVNQLGLADLTAQAWEAYNPRKNPEGAEALYGLKIPQEALEQEKTESNE